MKTIRRAFGFLAGMKGSVFTLWGLMLAASVIHTFVPLALGNVLDADGTLLPNLLILGGILIGGTVLDFFKSTRNGWISNTLSVKIRQCAFEKIQRLPMSYFASHNTGDVMSTVINDINVFRDALATGVSYIAEIAVSFALVTVIMIRTDALLTGVLFALLPITLLVSRQIGKPVDEIAGKNQQKLSEMTDILNQSIGGAEVIRSFTLQDTAKQFFRRVNLEWFGQNIRLVRLKSRNKLVTDLLNAVQLLTIIGFGMYRVSVGVLTIGELTAFALYAQSLSGPVSSMAGLYMDVKSSFAAIRRVFSLLDETEEAMQSGEELKSCEGSIEFQDVVFSYDTEHPVLDHVSFTVHAGERAAFVGESGAGKSTILNLIAGFRRPQSGTIRIDGRDIGQFRPDSLRKQIAYVTQSPFIFGMSVRDNIACGDICASGEEIVRSAKMANADAFIRALPDGYDTVSGERGCTLSGGQRQRIAIARALLKNAPILLMDEATSALDNNSERLVQQSVEALLDNRTTVTVAHRLSTILGSDVIFFLQNGKIVDQGKHAELLERCAGYRALYENASVSVGLLPTGSR